MGTALRLQGWDKERRASNEHNNIKLSTVAGSPVWLAASQVSTNFRIAASSVLQKLVIPLPVAGNSTA